MRRLAILGLCLLFALLAVLVAAGAFTPLDQHAVTHWMPGLDLGHLSGPTLRGVFDPVVGADGPWDVAADLLLYPASVPLSGIVVALCAWTLHRRGRTRAGIAWLAAWVIANAVDVVVKSTLTRPRLYDHGVHVFPFDDSLPSGHMLRAALVAAVLAVTWRRTAPLAAVWTAAVAVVLVLAGWHVPTDVLAGLVAAAALVLAVGESEEWRGARAGTINAP